VIWPGDTPYSRTRALARGSAKYSTYPADVLPAWVAEMDFDLAPPVKAALRAAIDNDDAGYLGARHDGLLEAFAGFAARRLGWTVDPAQVVVCTDVMVGVEELLQVLTGPGEGVIVNPPVYPPYYADIAHAGRRVVRVPLLEEGALDLVGIDRAFAGGAKALLLCNPHNPTGRVLPLEELVGLRDVAHAHGAWVISDEIHGPLAWDGYVPWLSVPGARGFTVTAASKAFNLAGLKLGLIVGEEVSRLPGEMHWRAGYLGAVGAEAGFREGDAWLDDTLAVLRANHGLLRTLLAAPLRVVRAQASFLAWLDCRDAGLGDDPAAVFLERGRVALSRGIDFGEPGRGFARLNVGTTPGLLEEAVRRLEAALTP
jgi:cystathionine beta-lyase